MTAAEYEKKIRLRRNVAAGLMVCGIAVLAAIAAAGMAGSGLLPDWAESFYSGTGTGLAAAGLIMLIKKSQLLKNKKRLEEQRLKENDERNVYLRDKSMVIASYILIVGLYLASLGAAAYSAAVALTMCMIICAFVVLILVVNVVLKKRY